MQKASEQKYEGVTDIRQRRLGRITSINSAFCTKTKQSQQHFIKQWFMV